MSFLDYIKDHASDNSPIGDYCSDTLRVLKMYPDEKRRLKYKKDFAALFNLVSIIHICQEARDAFEETWKEYRLTKKGR